MENIKLSNELEYPAYGFDQNGEALKVTIAGVVDFATFRKTLTKKNLETIEVYSEGGVLSTIFEGYTTLTGKFDIEENEDGTMNVTLYLEKPDPVLQRIAELEAEIAALKEAQN
jgi:hypothetical protein